MLWEERNSNFLLNESPYWTVSIPGPHEGWGQNTNPKYQLQPRVSTDLTSGAESAQKATSEIS